MLASVGAAATAPCLTLAIRCNIAGYVCLGGNRLDRPMLELGAFNGHCMTWFHASTKCLSFSYLTMTQYSLRVALLNTVESADLELTRRHRHIQLHPVADHDAIIHRTIHSLCQPSDNYPAVHQTKVQKCVQQRLQNALQKRTADTTTESLR